LKTTELPTAATRKPGFRVRWTGKKKNKKKLSRDSEVIKSPSLRVAAARYLQVVETCSINFVTFFYRLWRNPKSGMSDRNKKSFSVEKNRTKNLANICKILSTKIESETVERSLREKKTIMEKGLYPGKEILLSE